MSNIIIISSVLLLVLLFLKVPVFISILGGSLYYFLMNPKVNPIVFAQQAITGTESIALLAIPFFVCAGTCMNYTGVTKRIMDFCSVITGRMNGGLAQVNVLLSTLMGGLSGSNLADAAMEAKMLVPEMEKKGFSKAFSSVITAVSAMITPLIPPGIAMIIYGCIADVSIGKLFVSGISVGVFLCVTLMFFVSRISKKRGYVPIREEKLPKGEFKKAFIPAIAPLCLPIIIIGGIRIGVFTATEAGAAAIVYSVILGLAYKELKIDGFKNIFKETVSSTASIMLIISAATVFSWILTKERIPQAIAGWMINSISSKYLFLLIVNIFLLIVGMFIEGNASMIILVPLLHPVAQAYGINEIQFAMIYIFNSAIGSLSPPMGTLMFVTCGITKCKTSKFIKECLPFYLLLFIDLMLLTYVPFISTGLVNLIY